MLKEMYFAPIKDIIKSLYINLHYKRSVKLKLKSALVFIMSEATNKVMRIRFKREQGLVKLHC